MPFFHDIQFCVMENRINVPKGSTKSFDFSKRDGNKGVTSVIREKAVMLHFYCFYLFGYYHRARVFHPFCYYPYLLKVTTYSIYFISPWYLLYTFRIQQLTLLFHFTPYNNILKFVNVSKPSRCTQTRAWYSTKQQHDAHYTNIIQSKLAVNC